MELLTALVLALQPVQASTVTIAPPAVRVSDALLTASQHRESVSVRIEVPRQTPGWVKGGIIGGVAGGVLMFALLRAFDDIDHAGTPTSTYVQATLGGAFGGFVIGSLIGGN
jgi:membrane associated rhomboid family serine protease